jgi:hypothetical protein
MAQTQHTTVQRSFNHLKLDQRGMIAAYHDESLSSRAIEIQPLYYFERTTMSHR